MRGLLIQTCLPPYRPSIRLDHVSCMASHTVIVGLGGARRNELSVCGPAASADPFGGRGRIAHLLCRSSSGGQLLQGAPDELRRLSRSSGRKRSTNGIICGRYPVAQPHQRLDGVL